MPSDFQTITKAAARERKLTIDPRHEEPSHGDFPWEHTPPPVEGVPWERDWDKLFEVLFIAAVGTIGAIAFAWGLWQFGGIVNSILAFPG